MNGNNDRDDLLERRKKHSQVQGLDDMAIIMLARQALAGLPPRERGTAAVKNEIAIALPPFTARHTALAEHVTRAPRALAEGLDDVAIIILARRALAGRPIWRNPVTDLSNEPVVDSPSIAALGNAGNRSAEMSELAYGDEGDGGQFHRPRHGHTSNPKAPGVDP
jgi:hypothetical protein